MPADTAPRSLPRADMIPWPGLNARRRFDEAEMEELRESIKHDGLGQPIGVKMNPEPPHWIFAGERRWRAAEGILEDIPVHVRDLSEEAAVRMNLVENVQRNDLDPVEEAHALDRYLNTAKKNQTQVAGEIGKSQGWVANRLRLLRLPETMQDFMMEGHITASQARDLLLPFGRLPDELWEVFATAALKKLMKKASNVKRPLKDEELRLAASEVAVHMSAPLDQTIYSVDNQERFPYHIRVPKERWKKAPKGTVISYLYGLHPNAASSRAFDHDWWDQEMALAQTKHQEKERKRQEASGEKFDPEDCNLEWTPEMGPIPESVEIPEHKMHIVYEPVCEGETESWMFLDPLGSRDPVGKVRKGNLNADPTAIPKENLVLAIGSGGPETWDQDLILCTNLAVFESAESLLVQKRDEVVDRKLKRKMSGIQAEAEKVNLADSIVDIFMAAYHGTARPFADSAMAAGIRSEAFIDLAKNIDKAYGNAMPDELWAGLAELPEDERNAFLRYQVAALRGGLIDGDPEVDIRLEVGTQMREELVKELADMIDLPEWKPEPEQPAQLEEESEGAADAMG